VLKLAAAEKSCAEKAIHIDLVSNQLMDIKKQQEAMKESHCAELSAIEAGEGALRAQLAVKEEALKNLQLEFHQFHNKEREKRLQAVIQMKEEMTTLAKEQFSIANQHYFAAKSQLEEAMKELAETKDDRDAAALEQQKLYDDIKKAHNSAKIAGTQIVAAESVLANREKERLEEVRELRQKSNNLQAQLDAMIRARDSTLLERQAMQDKLTACASRETELIHENVLLKLESERVLSSMRQAESNRS
jgi:hypothetical protein